MNNKFRGYYYGGKREKYWYGQLVCHEDQYFLCSFPSGYFIKTRVEKDTIQQFIGLRDIKGTEIYTGDVLASVRLDGSVDFYVVFERNGGFVINAHSDDFVKPITKIQFTEACADMQTSVFVKQCEVIGNVIANPNFYNEYHISI